MVISAALRHELLALSPEERESLADDLYESVIDDSLDPDWSRAWSTEVVRRMADVAGGRAELIDADEVHRDLRSELDAARRSRHSPHPGYWQQRLAP
ncbi:MAG TPA: addiction module protein [Kofleriaceae bacterium]|jgi:putative addiction module component (TIGR02574 family)